MNRALYAAASGMAAQQRNMDVVADNLANADVVGFKSATATFTTLGTDAQLGTAFAGGRTSFAQGKLERSGGPFDVAIDGAGFFAVERDGEIAYTRAGAFSRSADGRLRNAAGWALRGIRIPADAVSITVAADGRVNFESPGHGRREAGRLRLTAFAAPELLRPAGTALFAATQGSGPPRELPAGGDRQSKIVFGSLEKSNVSIVESMMAILAAQRAYEANAKGVQASDEMLRIANNLHRS
jgi:flagellar basal-body rod protein FlgG